MNKPQPQTGPEIEEYSTTATPKAYAGSVPVFCAHDAIVPLKDLRPNPKNPQPAPAGADQAPRLYHQSDGLARPDHCQQAQRARHKGPRPSHGRAAR